MQVIEIQYGNPIHTKYWNGKTWDSEPKAWRKVPQRQLNQAHIFNYLEGQIRVIDTLHDTATTNTKYKTDLAKVAIGGNERVMDTLEEHVKNNFHIKFVRKGSTLYHNRRFTQKQIIELRAFAYGLMYAGYGDD